MGRYYIQMETYSSGHFETIYQLLSITPLPKQATFIYCCHIAFYKFISGSSVYGLDTVKAWIDQWLMNMYSCL